ncbi:MAG TPA: gluconolaconase [Blastocatellia bacterium]|nr:gluconolaconase [Blastocatellia bacterium]
MRPVIHRVTPAAGVEGGEVIITCSDFDTSRFSRCHVLFGEAEGRIVGAGPDRVIATIPPEAARSLQPVPLMLEANGAVSEPVPFTVGSRIADQLHPVTNPAYDVDTGYLYVTYSGSRGQKVPCSVYRISPLGEKTEFLHDIMNATAIAFDSEGTMFVTSRYDGTVLRVTPFSEAEPFARDLGTATGLAFDREGRMYVGDRNGAIYVVNDIGEAKVFAELEPSVSAYHLAFGPDGYLYVTGPTASSWETVSRISPDGDVEPFYTGLGRPQGLAFDTEGNLYVAASLRGHRGIIKITPGGEASLFAAGKTLVGLVFDDAGNMILASTQGEIYRLPVGIRGYLLEFW